jgi:DNA invertase Pin-like site-specific DNA recombinase
MGERRDMSAIARVSTKGGRQETENQLIALRDYWTKQGWKISGEYVDHETGGTSKRPYFQRLFADARARKFDLVLFWSLDRLSREGVSATLDETGMPQMVVRRPFTRSANLFDTTFC